MLTYAQGYAGAGMLFVQSQRRSSRQSLNRRLFGLPTSFSSVTEESTESSVQKKKSSNSESEHSAYSFSGL